MSESMQSEEMPVTARKLTDEAERMRALPKHFGRHGLRFEMSVYNMMNEYAKEYTGGYWEFFELSNGGFYMAPQAQEFTFIVPGNGYEGRMSADAAGITACLHTLSRLSFALDGVDEAACEKVADHFHLLRDFASEHAEASAIFGAID